ncbi:glutamate racemase [Bacteroidales bacterium OttesenSCG-928-M11]|nr:glutamate racemase [Bacteroidales bacterium OttesenSCG-928-M11]
MIKTPIGIFDSGYGGLTILEEIRKLLPKYDYLYLGDNARTPYGTRSFDLVYEFSLQAVEHLFAEGCPLVIFACNTASAKALRTIQQNDLPRLDSGRRVLGVIRPTAEIAGSLTTTRHIGVLGTPGTISSESYSIEINKLFPDIQVTGEACPMWVPLVENREYNKLGADYFVKQHIDRLLSVDSEIDTIILGCTHYPLLIDKIKSFLPSGIQVVSQGKYVAESLEDYLVRHPEIESRISQTEGTCRYLTTEAEDKFSTMASVFLRENIKPERIVLS